MRNLGYRATLAGGAPLLVLSWSLALAGPACSSDGGSGRDGGSGTNGSMGPTSSGDSGGTQGSMGVATTAGMGGSATTGLGGSSTTTADATSTAGPSTTTSMGGATSGSAGGAASTTDAGTTGSAGSGGTNSNLSGGASGAFICQAGATYGDPLAGMGTVQEIGPADGDFFSFIEGPIWLGGLGTLFFSDHSSPRRIFKLVPPSTAPEVFSDDSASNGIALDNDDQLIVAEEQRSRIVRIDPQSTDPTSVDAGNVLVDGVVSNDLIYRSDGNLYFTNPSQGFYRADPTGAVTGPMTEVGGPNGIVLSPDENTLYVGSVQNQEIWSFPLDAGGVVDTASGSVLANTVNSTLDGMAVDCAGNIYGGTANGVEVFSSAGQALGIVPTGEASNVTFGGADRKTLYVTSRALLKSVTLAVPGLPD